MVMIHKKRGKNVDILPKNQVAAAKLNLSKTNPKYIQK